MSPSLEDVNDRVIKLEKRMEVYSTQLGNILVRIDNYATRHEMHVMSVQIDRILRELSHVKIPPVARN